MSYSTSILYSSTYYFLLIPPQLYKNDLITKCSGSWCSLLICRYYFIYSCSFVEGNGSLEEIEDGESNAYHPSYERRKSPGNSKRFYLLFRNYLTNEYIIPFSRSGNVKVNEFRHYWCKHQTIRA